MIVNFYKEQKCLKSLNIGIIPRKNEYVTFAGQVFIVIAIEFDLNEQYEQYNIYLKRATQYGKNKHK